MLDRKQVTTVNGRTGQNKFRDVRDVTVLDSGALRVTTGEPMVIVIARGNWDVALTHLEGAEDPAPVLPE